MKTKSPIKVVLTTLLVTLAINHPALAANLPLNSVVNGDISRPGQQDVYTFTGATGQRLYYDSRQTDVSQPIGIRLVSPTGNSPNINGQNSGYDLGPFTLAESGTYTFIVDGVGATTGSYSFRMVDLGTVPALTLSTVITHSLDPGNSVDWYRFNAVGGEHLFFDGLGANAGATWYLFSPYNELLGQAGIGADFEATLTVAGQYLVAVAGSSASPVPYSVQVVPFTITTKALTLDTTNTGTLAGPGDQVAYTFTVAAGQRLYYDALDADPSQIGLRLIHPNGNAYLLNGQNAHTDYGPFTLVDAGTYTLFLDGAGSTTGSYSFRLQNLLAAPVLQLDTVITKTLTPGYSTDWYRFNGTAGQQLYFDGLGANAGANWYLYGPVNNQIGGTSIGNDFETVLLYDGQYLVPIWGNSPNPVPYSVEVVSFGAPTLPLTLGTTVTGNIAEPGEKHLYTFAGTPGERIYYDTLDRDSESINARLLSPNGTVIWEVNQSTDVGPTVLTANGTYTLVIDGNGPTVGDFSFRVLNLASAAAMTLTGPVNGSLSPRSETDLYQFNGTKGQRISFDSISVTGNEATWRLVGPANETLVQGAISQDLASVTLPETGVMTLLIEGTAENVAPLNYQVRLADVSDAPVAASGLNVVITGTLTAGLPTTNTFKGPAGLLIYFDTQDTTSFGATVDIRDPVNNVFQSLAAYIDSGPYVLPLSGTYSVVTRGTGAYRFRILDLAANSVALTLGNEVQQTLDPAYKTDVYRFNGTTGQRLFYDALENDNDQVYVRLLAPDFTWPINNPNADTDTGPITLQLAGPYYLFVESRVATPTDYHFRLLDASAAPVAALDTPITDSLTPGLGATVLRIAGNTGQLLFFDGAVGNSGANWYLYGPNNEYLQGTGVGSDFEYTLTQPTGYLLVLTSSSINPVGYTVEVVNSNGGNAAPDAPSITSVSAAGTVVTITWTAIAGKSYFLQSKSAVEGATWSDVPGAVNATGASASKTDNAGSATARFYQVRLVP